MVNTDGKVHLVEGSTDIGGSRASASMMLAETLGIPAEDINPEVVDTDSIGLTGGTGGSSVTHKIGIAVNKVGLKIIEEMSKRLAERWEIAADTISYENATFAANGKSMSFKEAAAVLAKDGPIMCSHAENTRGAGPAFGTHIVDVEVDPETGKVKILRYTAVQDVGKAIHPSYVEGQIQGGVTQGIGWAMNEEYFYDKDGHLLNASLLDYRMPTALDLPMIDCVMVEVANPNHPFGVRGVGEVPIVPPGAALAHAIYNATGVRMTTMPMNPGKVALALVDQAVPA
jgi:CO/xanthine dehydrogenase Mo-binding subunit